MKKRTCYNVELFTTVDGRAQRYKGHLVVPCSIWGTGHERMPGGNYEPSTGVGGLVFEDERAAMELHNALAEYFKTNKLTVCKETASLIYRVWHRSRLWLRYGLWRKPLRFAGAKFHNTRRMRSFLKMMRRPENDIRKIITETPSVKGPTDLKFYRDTDGDRDKPGTLKNKGGD